MPKAEISRVNTLIYTCFCLLTIKISKQIKISGKLNAFISLFKVAGNLPALITVISLQRMLALSQLKYLGYFQYRKKDE